MVRIYDDPLAHGLEGSHIQDEDDDSFTMPGTDDWTLGIPDDDGGSPHSLDSFPRVSAWKEPSDHEVFASVDAARADCEEPADKEFKFLLGKLVANQIMDEGENHRAVEADKIYARLINWIFGPHSLLFRRFEEVPLLKDNHAPFARCVATFFVTCRYGENLRQLLKGARIRLHGDGLAKVNLCQVLATIQFATYSMWVWVSTVATLGASYWCQ